MQIIGILITVDTDTLDYSCPYFCNMQTQRYAKDVEEKKEQYEHYNILPLYAVGVKPAIMELPEVVPLLKYMHIQLCLCLLLFI